MKWYVKASLQKAFSLVPYGESLNFAASKRFGRHQGLHLGGRIREMRRIYSALLDRFGAVEGLEIAEIGTGWNPVLPLALSLTGGRCRTFDVRRLVKKDIVRAVLAELGNHLEALAEMSGCPVEGIRKKYGGVSPDDTLEDVLGSCGVLYSAPVDTGSLPLEDGSQDAVVSRAVLQCIPAQVLGDVIRETYRVLKPGGLSVHIVSLHDEYSEADPSISSVNFLKYPRWFWDAFGNNYMIHINRLRYPYYLELFKESGFEIIGYSTRIDERSLRMLETMKIDREFRNYSREELAAVGLTITVEKPAGSRCASCT